jgi:cytochrome c peroxidase
MRGKRLWISLAGAVCLLTAAIAWLEVRLPSPTPLAGFSAPFVFGAFAVPADNPLTVEAVELGRRLFYDPRMSATGQIACATCHVQSLAFTDGKTTSVGASGVPLAFNSMSLANLLWGPQHFFWNGRTDSLEAQVLMPITHPDEMDQDLDRLVADLRGDADYARRFQNAYGGVDRHTIAKALASFLRTLVSSNSKYDQYLRGAVSLTAQEELGRKLFLAHPDTKASLRGGNCIDCHSQFLTGGFKTQYDGFSNNGLDDEAGLSAGLQEVTGNPAHRGFFKVPTLRNIAVTAPYMHDGRFATLEAVLDHYDAGVRPSSTLSPLILEASNDVDAGEAISLHLSDEEKAAIVAFLHTLTDHEFLIDPSHADPFENDGYDGT